MSFIRKKQGPGFLINNTSLIEETVNKQQPQQLPMQVQQQPQQLHQPQQKQESIKQLQSKFKLQDDNYMNDDDEPQIPQPKKYKVGERLRAKIIKKGKKYKNEEDVNVEDEEISKLSKSMINLMKK